jgi:hypothetical protein
MYARQICARNDALFEYTSDALSKSASDASDINIRYKYRARQMFISVLFLRDEERVSTLLRARQMCTDALVIT